MVNAISDELYIGGETAGFDSKLREVHQLDMGYGLCIACSDAPREHGWTRGDEGPWKSNEMDREKWKKVVREALGTAIATLIAGPQPAAAVRLLQEQNDRGPTN